MSLSEGLLLLLLELGLLLELILLLKLPLLRLLLLLLVLLTIGLSIQGGSNRLRNRWWSWQMSSNGLESILISNVFDLDQLAIRSSVGIRSNLDHDILFHISNLDSLLVQLGHCDLLGESRPVHLDSVASLITKEEKQIIDGGVSTESTCCYSRVFE